MHFKQIWMAPKLVFILQQACCVRTCLKFRGWRLVFSHCSHYLHCGCYLIPTFHFVFVFPNKHSGLQKMSHCVPSQQRVLGFRKGGAKLTLSRGDLGGGWKAVECVLQVSRWQGAWRETRNITGTVAKWDNPASSSFIGAGSMNTYPHLFSKWWSS